MWFSEHHFTGETVYADPIMFATAVAMQTRRVKLGFAVLEMALYHPVRVAEQIALLDNLSGGRVIVGIARGSAFNAYEYRGFGTSVQFGRECLDEAEELLVKCWAARDGLEFHGKYWDVVLPEVRPHPVQQPHPPVLRAAVGPPAGAKVDLQIPNPGTSHIAFGVADIHAAVAHLRAHGVPVVIRRRAPGTQPRHRRPRRHHRLLQRSRRHLPRTLPSPRPAGRATRCRVTAQRTRRSGTPL